MRQVRRGHRSDHDESDFDDTDDSGDDAGHDPVLAVVSWVSKPLASTGRLARPLQAYRAVLEVPCVKFTTHNLFALCYFGFLTVGLCGPPWHGSEWLYRTGLAEADRLPIWEIVSWGWNALRFIEEVQQLLQTKDKADYFGDIYNRADLYNYLSILVCAIIRTYIAYDCGWPGESVCKGQATVGNFGVGFDTRNTLLRVSQFLYAFSLLLLSVRLINMLKVHRGVGVLIIM